MNNRRLYIILYIRLESGMQNKYLRILDMGDAIKKI